MHPVIARERRKEGKCQSAGSGMQAWEWRFGYASSGMDVRECKPGYGGSGIQAQGRRFGNAGSGMEVWECKLGNEASEWRKYGMDIVILICNTSSRHVAG